MKSIGIVRKVDKTGRIVIPKELMTSFTIQDGDPLEFYTEGNSIVIKKYVPGCIFCGSSEEVTHFHGKRICGNCIKEMR